MDEFFFYIFGCVIGIFAFCLGFLIFYCDNLEKEKEELKSELEALRSEECERRCPIFDFACEKKNDQVDDFE